WTRVGGGRGAWAREESWGKGPDPLLRDRQGFGDGRAALPGRRAGAGGPALDRLSPQEVRAAEQGAGMGCRGRAADAAGRDGRHGDRTGPSRPGSAGGGGGGVGRGGEPRESAGGGGGKPHG